MESHTKHIEQIPQRATFSSNPVNLDEVASVTSCFRLPNELAIQSNVLSHPAVLKILQCSESLTSLVLRGRCALLKESITVLENLPGLQSLHVSNEVRMCDEVIRRVCTSCPRLEKLKINTKSVRVAVEWSGFPYLTSLSVTTVLTNSLLSCFRNCPNFQSLKIDGVANVNGISVSQALQGFPKLRSATVRGYPDTGWFVSSFPRPILPLECIDAPCLVIKKEQLHVPKQTCLVSPRKLTVNDFPV